MESIEKQRFTHQADQFILDVLRFVHFPDESSVPEHMLVAFLSFVLQLHLEQIHLSS